MKAKWLLIVTTVLLLVYPKFSFGQAPGLGTAANFVLFTGVGAVGNSSSPDYLTHLTGNVGSNSAPTFTGFGNVDGVMENINAVTSAAAADLLIAYNELDTATPTFHPVSGTMGNGDTLIAGVYALPGASVLNGILYINGAGDSNALFIIQVPGTFSVNTNAKVVLLNGAKACNIFWKIEGVISVSSGAFLRGTFIAHNAAINMNTNDTLEGRALSTSGAISVNGIIAYTPIGCGSPHLTGPAAPALASIKYYAVLSGTGAVTDDGASHITGDVGTNGGGTTTGFTALFINGMIHPSPDASTATAAGDLSTINTYLSTLSYDIELLAPAEFGHSLVLTPHTYLLNAATSLTDTIILNAENDTNAVFVFQINGALSTSTFADVKLINGARYKNVYWQVTGAVTVNNNSVFNGNIVSSGAIFFATGASGSGRALTTSGAITLHANTINANVLQEAGPITGSATVCVGASTPLHGVDTGGVWRSSNTNASVNDTGLVTGVRGGLDTISYAVTNRFGTDTALYFITVNPLPVAGPITGPSSVCVGSTITLAGADSAGVFSRSNLDGTISSLGVFTGDSAGIDTITYVVTNTCGVDSATKAITVIAIPRASVIAGPSTVCVGSSVTLSDTTTGGTWSASNGRATINSFGVLTGVSAGFDTISYRVANTCGADTATKLISVNPLPNAGTITGASTVCVGSSTTLTDAITGGVWSATNTHASVTSGSVTGLSQGVDTIRYIITNSCGRDTASKIVTVNPQPNADVISGPATVCVGSIITLTDTATGGTWSATNTHATVVAGLVTGVTAGVDTIRYIVTNTCGTDIAVKIITIGGTANAGTIAGASSVCPGSTITLTDGVAGGTWSATNTHATVVAGLVTGVTAGVDTIRYIVTNTCGTDTAVKIITIGGTANAGTIAGASSVCPGSTITLTDGVAGGTWSATNANATVVAGLVTGVTAGVDTIRYIVTNTCGTDTAVKIITIGGTANAGTIAGASSVCPGSTITLTDGVAGGTWSATNSNATVVAGLVTGVTAGVDTIRYIVTNTCGTDTAVKIITIGGTANAGTIAGALSVCPGSTITLTDGVAGGTWSATNTHATVVAGLVTGVTAGVDTIRYIVTNTCGTDTAVKIVTISPLPNAGVITGPSVVCSGSSITLTDATTGGTWSASNTHATVVAGLVTGVSVGADTIRYVVINSCGADTATHIVTVSGIASAGLILGSSSVCAGSSISLTDAVTGGTWSATNANATVAAGVVTGILPGLDTINYIVNSTCGADTATKVINVNPLPNAGTIFGASSLCVGNTLALTDATTGGVWSATNLNAIVIAGSVTGISAGVDTIRYIVNNSCGADTANKIVTVSPLPNAGTISGPSTVCAGASISLTDAVTGGTWLATNANASVVAGLVTGLTAGVDTIRYIVTNSCGSDTANKTVTINPLPNAGVISGPSSVCIGLSITQTDFISGGTWSLSNANATLAGSVVTGAIAGNDTVNYTVTNSCGTATVSKPITVNPLPNAGTISGASSVCIGASITLTDAASGGPWATTNGNATITSGGVVTGVTAGIDTISYSATNVCGTATTTKIITVNPLPYAGVISGPGSICLGSSATFTNFVSGGLWSSTANATSAFGVMTGIAAGFDTIRYAITDACGSSIATKVFLVSAYPVFTSSATPAAICDGTTFTYASSTDSARAVYSWIRPVVVGISNNVDSGTGNINEVLNNITASPITVSYNYTASVNGCTVTRTMTVDVNPTPRLGGITSNAVCSGNMNTYVIVALTPGTGTNWVRPAVTGITPDSSFGSRDINEVLTNTTLLPITVSYNFTLVANGCTSHQSIRTTVNPLPTAPVITTAGPANVCSGTMYQNFGAAAPTVGLRNYWTVTNGVIWATSANGQNTLVSFPNAGNATVTLWTNLLSSPCQSKTTYNVNVSSAVAQVPTVRYFQFHFVCTPNNEDSYQWGYDDATTLDSTMLVGEINQDYVNAAPDYAHKNYWVHTRNSGCDQKTYYNVPLAVQEINAADAVVISLYPNPANELLHVSVGAGVTGNITVEVANMTGQQMSVTAATNHAAIVNVDSLPSGVYLVSCFSDGVKVGSARFVKN